MADGTTGADHRRPRRSFRWAMGAAPTSEYTARRPLPSRRRPTITRLVLSLAMLALLIAAIVAALAAIARGAAALLAGALNFPLLGWMLPLLIGPGVTMLLAVAVLALGLPRANRRLHPKRFRLGVVALALAIATSWPLQYAASRGAREYPDASGLLHLVALFASICVATGGIEAIRRANNTPEDDSWEFF